MYPFNVCVWVLSLISNVCTAKPNKQCDTSYYTNLHWLFHTLRSILPATNALDCHYLFLHLFTALCMLALLAPFIPELHAVIAFRTLFTPFCVWRNCCCEFLSRFALHAYAFLLLLSWIWSLCCKNCFIHCFILAIGKLPLKWLEIGALSNNLCVFG